MLEDDERPAFWQRATGAREADQVSEAATEDELGELNAEPLLLHLLIVSGYTGDTWREAAENRNLVYEEIFKKIYARDQEKPNPPNQSEDDFFTLLECLGLAAWRGNGRTGSDENFKRIRSQHWPRKPGEEPEKDPQASLEGVAVQFYTRRDVGGEGFEFLHKSFGEYLIARALLHAGLREARRLSREDDPIDAAAAAENWARLIGRSEMTEEVLGYLVDEARLMPLENAAEALIKGAGEQADKPGPLVALFNWVLAHGMPVQKTAGDASYRDLERRQRCAEAALVAVIHALNRRRLDGVDGPEPGAAALPVRWPHASAARFALERLQVTSAHVIRCAVSFLDLREADLGGADLRGADLRGADLRRADLRKANLSGADLSGADLRGADLRGADLGGADLGGADLGEADLIRADLGWADLGWADLRGADLRGADLGGASLSGADLIGADLRNCSLTRVSLRFADLVGSRHLASAAVRSAFGVSSGIGRTRLPDGMAPPDHWHVAVEGEEDTPEASAAYEAAYRAWVAAQDADG